jgi:hypothetical protein
VVNIAGKSPIQDFDTGGNINLTGLPNWMGVLAWKRGALLVSFVWVAMLVMVIDRHWSMAAVWAGIGAMFALFGIIHVPEAGFETFTSPVWEQCQSSDDCWEHGQQWKFFVAYLMLAGTFGLIELARRFGDETLLPRIEDEEAEQVFADWFAEAGTVRSHDHDGKKVFADDKEDSADMESSERKDVGDLSPMVVDDIGMEIEA